MSIAIAFFAGVVTIIIGATLGWFARDTLGRAKGEASIPLVSSKGTGWSEPAVGSDLPDTDPDADPVWR